MHILHLHRHVFLKRMKQQNLLHFSKNKISKIYLANILILVLNTVFVFGIFLIVALPISITIYLIVLSDSRTLYKKFV